MPSNHFPSSPSAHIRTSLGITSIPAPHPRNILGVATSHPPNLGAAHMGITGSFGKPLMECFLLRLFPEILFPAFPSPRAAQQMEQPALAEVLSQHNLNPGRAFLFAKLAQPFHRRVLTATCVFHVFSVDSPCCFPSPGDVQDVFFLPGWVWGQAGAHGWHL